MCVEEHEVNACLAVQTSISWNSNTKIYWELDYVIPLQDTFPYSKKYKEYQRREKITMCLIRIRYKNNYMYDSASVNCSFDSDLEYTTIKVYLIMHDF